MSFLTRRFSKARLPLLTLLILAGLLIGFGVWAAVETRLIANPRRLFATTAPKPVTVAAPLITATKTATLATDVNSNGFVNPGDTLMYSVTVTNSGTDATSVNFTDQLNANLTLSGTATASPIATNDSYTNVVGNVGISVPAGSGVLANDINPQGTGTLAITAVPAGTTAQGGSYALAADGSFSYNPPVGFQGTDSFNYTLTHSNGKMDTGTVTLTVSGMIWFVNNNAGACAANCNGRLSNPFISLANFNAVNDGASGHPGNNDNIFAYESSTQYTGAVTLRSGQKLIGQDATASLASIAGITLPTFSNALPAMDSANGTITNLSSTVTLNTNATVRGLSINSTTSTGMNDPAGAITGVSVSEVNVATTTGTAVLLSSTGGTLSFISISSNGATNGINLTSTTGSFTVTGMGGTCTLATPTCTGGSIQSSTGPGILINTSAQSVSLTRMKIQNSGTHSINTTGVNGFTLDNSIVTDSAGTATDDGLLMTNTSGTVTISNSTISNAPHNGMTVDNFNTNMAGFNFTNSTISCASGQPCQPSGSIGNDGLLLVMRGTSVLTSGGISGSTFSGVRAVAVQVQANDSGSIGANSGGSITAAIVVQSNTFTGNGQGIDIGSSQVSSVTFQVLSNTLVAKVTSPSAISNQASSHAINAFTAAGADTGPAAHSFVGKIDGNIIGTQGVKDSGSGIGSGIRVVVQGRTTQGNVTVSNNTIREVPNSTILNFIGQNGAAASGTATARFKITNNNMAVAPSGSNLSLCGPVNSPCGENGIFVLADEGTPVCNAITGNNIFDLSAFGFDIYLAERVGPPAGAQLTVEGTGGSNSTYIQANNTLAGANKFIDEGNNTSQVGLGACGTFVAFAPPVDRGQPQWKEQLSSTAQVAANNDAPSARMYQILNPIFSAFASPVNYFNVSRLSNWFVPTVMAAEASFESKTNLLTDAAPRNIGNLVSRTMSVAKSVPLPAMFAGELITINGGGGGFTLPAGKSVTIMFNATISNSFTGNAITNQANVTAAGGININSNNLSTPVIQAPGIVKSFLPANIALANTNQTISTLTLTLTNPNTSQQLTNVAFTDSLPSGLVVDTTPTPTTTGCGAPTFAPAANATSLNFSSGTINVGTPCVVTVKVKGTGVGAKANTANGATSTQANTGAASNTATLNVLTAPSFTKSFGASTVTAGGTTALTFNITNNDTAFGLTGVNFSDPLPTGLTVASMPNIVGGCGGGTITAAANSGTISLSGAALAASGTCSFSVDVTGTTAGVKNNSVSLVTTETGTNNTPATATLNVFGPPTISKVFATNPIVVGQTSVLNITITNPASNPGSLTGLSFTDTLPAGISAPNSSTASCGGGTLVVSGNVITLTNGSLASGANCVNSVTVTGIAASGSAYTNTISSVSSTNGGTNSTPATANITVNKASTTASITADTPDPSVVGQPYAVTAGVAVTAPGSATPTAPTGTITVSDGSQSCTINMPGTSCNLTSTTAGAKTLTATYNGDSNFNASTVSSGVAHTVNKANTTTAITADTPDPSNPGQAVAVNFTVTPNSPGTGTPTGNVTISDSASAATCTASVAAGTCNITLTTPGSRTLTATYAGDANFNTSASAGEPHQVATPPTIAKSFTPAQIKVGETSVMSFSIANPNAALSLSNISFSDTFPAGIEVDSPLVATNTCGGSFSPAPAGGATNFSYSGGSLASGASPCTISVQVKATSAGLKNNTTGTISATETGTGATSNTATLTVVGAPTLAKSFSPASILFGQTSSLGFTITNSNTTVALNGINFTDTLPAGMTVATSGPTATCGGMLSTNAPNVISFTGGMLAAGNPNPTTCSFNVTVTPTQPGMLNNTTGVISATESGSGTTSNTATLTISKSNTTTLLSSSINPSVFGQSVTFTATVAAVPPGSGIPTGNVIFLIDGNPQPPVALVVGQATLTTSTLTVGTYPVVANYAGDTNFNSSGSATLNQVVNKASTTLSNLSDTPDPSVTGESYTAGFTLNVTAPGGGTPTGTVTVTDGTGGTCTATLPATSCSISSTSIGAKTLTFTYSGDANFNGSSNTTGHQVNKADTTTTITAGNPDPSVFGGNVTVNYSVVATAPGGGTPTGNVVVTVSGGAETCTGTVGAGSCTLALTTPGNRTLTATYVGDANYNGSSDTEAHTVNKADTTTTIVSDNPDSSAVGQNVTVLYTVVASAPGTGTPSGNVTVSDGVNSCTGTVAAGSCILALTTPGDRTLTATYASDTNFNGSSDTESHTVVAPPTMSKIFSPSNVSVGQTSTLTFTITNPAANTVALTGVGFTDSFPNTPNLVVAAPLTVTNTCGGTVQNSGGGVLIAGDTGIKLAGGTVGTNAPRTCTISVNVTPQAQGPFNNVSGAVSSTNGGTGNTASATLLTNEPPTLTTSNIARIEGISSSNSQIGLAADKEDAANTLQIQVSNDGVTFGNSATLNGVSVTLSDLNGSATGMNPDAAGKVFADAVAACGATNATFSLRVTDSGGQTATKTFTVNVTSQPTPIISINDVTLNEGNAGTTAFTFTVGLNVANLCQTITVNYATANGTATTADSDYTATSGMLSFAPGETNKSLTVLVNGDLNIEPNETFLVNLTTPVNATIADNQGQGTITNDDFPPFTSSLTDPFVCNGIGSSILVTAQLTNPNNTPQAGTFNVTLPVSLTLVPGTCTSTIGACTPTPPTQVAWSGNIPAGQTVTFTYQAQIADGTPDGTIITINSSGSVNGIGATTSASGTVSCPGLTQAPEDVKTSDQKAGSLVVFPYYISKSGSGSDTKLHLSNTGEVSAFVHLFFIDGATCNQADYSVCLTPNASLTFLASEMDPDTTGWLIALVVDAQGNPIQNNGLIGNAFVNDGNYVGNYGAESFWAYSNNLATINSDTATLRFNGTAYDAMPNQFAVEIQSPRDIIGQKIVTVGMSGDITRSTLSGAAQLGIGVAYNGNEKPVGSFSGFLNGICQASATITGVSPRVPFTMAGIIPAGQVGTIKLNIGGGVGLLLTPQNSKKWSGIRGLHKTGTTFTTITIPVLPPKC